MQIFKYPKKRWHTKMIQYIALNLLIKFRWLFTLVGSVLIASFLYGEHAMSIKVMFTGILLNLISLTGFAANIVKLTNTPIEMIE